VTTIAELTLSPAEFALGETIQSLPGLELRVERVVAETSTQAGPLVWVSGVDRADLHRALDADETINEVHPLLDRPSADRRLYRLRYAEGAKTVSGTVHTNGGTVLEARAERSRWLIRMLFSRREELSSAVSAIEERGHVVDVRRMVEAGQDDDLETTSTLTDPQREAISEAYQRGYYDVPREISLEELARKLDISHQALSERLRRANRVLAGEQLEGGVPPDEAGLN
jgi:predicted DNA binding protein